MCDGLRRFYGASELTCAILNGLLIVASVFVLVTTCRQNCDAFTLFSASLIVLSSATAMASNISGFIGRDQVSYDSRNVGVGPVTTVSTNIFAWFHFVFASQYFRSSRIVPVELKAEEVSDSVTYQDEVNERKSKIKRIKRCTWLAQTVGVPVS